MTGDDFNDKYAGIEFYKLTNKKEIHNGFQFKTGLNIDTIPLNPNGECNPGGIYFTEFDNILLWINYNGYKMANIRKVIIPNNAKVYIEKNKFKADQIILDEPLNLNVFLENRITNEICINAINKSCWVIRSIPNSMITYEMYLTAIRQDGSIILVTPESMITSELCFAAVHQNGWNLEYIPKQFKSFEIYLEAVKQDGRVLQIISDKHKTKEICMTAVSQNGWSIQVVNESLLSTEICMAAVRQAGRSLQFIPESFITLELCRTAVNQDIDALRFVPDIMKSKINFRTF